MRFYGGPKTDWGYSVAVDAAGSAYTVGNFEKEATFGAYHLVASRPDLCYYTDGYLCKWDSAGQVLWARQLNSSQYANITKVLATRQSDIYLRGTFIGTTNIGGSTLTQQDFLVTGVFVARYDTAGTRQWASLVPNGIYDSIATDAEGHLYIVTDQFFVYRSIKL